MKYKLLLSTVFLQLTLNAQHLNFDGVNDYVNTPTSIASFTDQISFGGWLYVNNLSNYRNILFGKTSDQESVVSLGGALAIGVVNDNDSNNRS